MFKKYFGSITPSQQLILLIIITLSSWIILSIVGTLIGTLIFDVQIFENPSELLNDIPFLKYFQAIQSIGLFIIPPILFSWLYQNNISSWLLMNKQITFWHVIFAVSIVLISQPLISSLGVFNNEIDFPNYLKEMSNWMRQKENEAQKMTEIFLNSTTSLQIIINVVIIAILPAIGEEFLFRGALQRILNNLFKNKHIAVFISAILFSAMHIQFFGFLPRFLLGIIFGYLVTYGGNIWLAVIGHFTNNFTAFILYQNYLKKTDTVSPLDLGQDYPDPFWIFASSAGILLILWWFIRKAKNNKISYPHS